MCARCTAISACSLARSMPSSLASTSCVDMPASTETTYSKSSKSVPCKSTACRSRPLSVLGMMERMLTAYVGSPAKVAMLSPIADWALASAASSPVKGVCIDKKLWSMVEVACLLVVVASSREGAPPSSMRSTMLSVTVPMGISMPPTMGWMAKRPARAGSSACTYAVKNSSRQHAAGGGGVATGTEATAPPCLRPAMSMTYSLYSSTCIALVEPLVMAGPKLMNPFTTPGRASVSTSC
mmetsp:Transcript_4679/g.13647  ORF Transcript_4679/g.13647 Transcript_4679/m.13647 type:complete len:239 (-) Transcript_4679:1036-1752(-)